MSLRDWLAGSEKGAVRLRFEQGEWLRGLAGGSVGTFLGSLLPFLPASRDAAARNSRLLDQVENDLYLVCPRYGDVKAALRKFASRRLTEENGALGIVSARPGEGRTTIAVNLASTLAEIGEPVALVLMAGADVSLPPELNSQTGASFESFMLGEASLDEALRPAGKTVLSVLRVEPGLGKVEPLRMAAGLREVMDELKSRFRHVIIDLPPMLASEEAPSLLPGIDSVVLVARVGKTRIAELQETVNICGELAVSGVFLNQAKLSTPRWISRLLAVDDPRESVWQ